MIGTSIMEVNSSMMEVPKQEIKNGTVMLAHVERAKRTVEMSTLLTKN